MENILLKEIWIKSPVGEVFKSFTNEEAMLEWHGKEVELNPTPGGVYRVVFENGDTINGHFKKLIENEYISYKANYSGVETEVEIELIAENGGTTIKLKQEFLPKQDSSSFNMGWDYFLGILKRIKEY
jgi:uncharacterized protein YndB with AHSA1/START domain